MTQLSKPEEFDTFDQVLKGCRTKDVLFVQASMTYSMMAANFIANVI